MFDWNFITNEGGAGGGGNNDYAFVVISTPANLANEFASLAPTSFSAMLPDPVTEVPYSLHTGQQTYSYTVPVDGTYIISIGVANEEDDLGYSGLLIDNLRYGVSEEPTGLILSQGCCEARLYNADGTRKYMPPLTSTTFELTDLGGCGLAELGTLATWDEWSLDGTEYCDIQVFGVILYRGWLQVHERQIEDPERYSPRFFGLQEQLGRWLVRRRYVYAQATDIATIAADIIADVVDVAGRLPSITTDFDAVGITLQRFDAFDMSVTEALTALCAQSPGAAYWGCDVTTDATHANRIYLRPRPTATAYRYSIGGEVYGYAHPYDTGRIRNSVYLKGGPVSQPNLLRNPSFEEPDLPSETLGNLVSDYSFESGTPWTLAGGASRKKAGDAGAVGSPRSASYWLETDQNNETATQTVTGIDYTRPLTASLWARYEHATNSVGRTFSFKVEGLDAGDVVQATVNIATAADPGGVTYKKYSGAVDFTAYNTVVKAKLTITGLNGAASDDGLIFDDVALYYSETVVSSGWTDAAVGAATRVTVDYVHRGVTAKHGAYSVKLQGSSCDGTGSNYIEIYTADDSWVTIKPGQAYTIGVFVRGDGSNNVDFKLGVEEFNASGTSLGQTTSTPAAANLSAWTLYELQFTAAATAAQARVFFQCEANTIHYVDAWALVEGSLPYDWYSSGYWPGASYERHWTTNDIPPTIPGRAPAGLATAASTSITDWGVRETLLSNDQVIDSDTALAYLIGWFNAHAVPVVEEAGLELVIDDSSELAQFDGLYRLLNIPSAPTALWPKRIRYVCGETVRVSVTLGEDRPDLTGLMRRLAERG